MVVTQLESAASALNENSPNSDKINKRLLIQFRRSAPICLALSFTRVFARPPLSSSLFLFSSLPLVLKLGRTRLPRVLIGAFLSSCASSSSYKCTFTGCPAASPILSCRFSDALPNTHTNTTHTHTFTRRKGERIYASHVERTGPAPSIP